MSHRLHGFNNKHLFLAVLGAEKSKIKVLADLVFGEGFPPDSEKAMAPHSSTFAWKIPWMEEPGRLQSMGSLRVGHH